MTLCSKGVARAKVRASNGKPSILYNEILKRVGDRDYALDLYAKAMSDNFSKLFASVDYERDSNGEPTAEFVMQAVNNNPYLRVEPIIEEASHYSPQRDMEIGIKRNTIDPFDALADEARDKAREAAAKKAEEEDPFEAAAKADLEKARAKKQKGETKEEFNDKVGNTTNVEGKSIKDYRMNPRKERDIVDSEDAQNNRRRLITYSEVIEEIKHDVSNRRAIKRSAMAKLRQIDTPEARAEYKKLAKEIYELNNSIGFYSSRLKGMESMMTANQLYDDITAQLKHINTALDDENITEAQLLKFDKALKVWINVDHTFIMPHDSSDVIDTISAIKYEASRVYDKYIAKTNEVMTKTVRSLSNNEAITDPSFNYDVLSEFESRGDENIFHAFTMAISRNANAALQILHKLIDAGHRRMISRVNNFNKKVDTMVKGIKDFNIFAETYKDGTATGMLIHYVSPEFRDQEELFYEKLNKEVRNRDERFNQKVRFMRSNRIVLDPRILFANETLEDGTPLFDGIDTRGANANVRYTEDDLKKHEAEIVEALGGGEFAQQEFDILKARLATVIDAYKLELEAFNMNGEGLTDEKQIAKFNERKAKFITNNSPYVAAYNIEETMPVINAKGEYEYSYRLDDLPSVPRRYGIDSNGNTNKTVETGYYNDNYRKVLNDSKHAEFYKFYLNRVNTLNTMLPSHLKITANNDNYVAMMDKSLIDMVRNGNVKFGPEFEKAVMDLYTREKQSIVSTNKHTGRTEYRLGIESLNASRAEIEKEMTMAISEYQEKVGRPISIEEKFEIRKDVIAKITVRKSFDLGDILKVFNYQIENYTHKTNVADSLTAIRNLVDEAREVRKGKHNSVKLSKEASFANLKKQLDYYTEVFYGYAGTNGHVSDHKMYTKEEKAKREELDNQIGELKQAYAMEGNTMTEPEYEARYSALVKARDELGKYFSMDQVLRSALKYSQFKAMGYNYGASITNLIQGYISNSIESKDGRIFNTPQLLKAYGVMAGSVASFWTRSNISTPAADKVRNLAINYDLIGETSSELEFKKFDRDSILSNVYIFQNSTEYLNQGPVIIATMMNTKVDIIVNGETVTTNLWEITNEEGEIKDDIELVDDNAWRVGEAEGSGKQFIDTLAKVAQAISAVHGNYSKLTPTLMNSNAVLASMKQFKTWMFEAIAQRLEDGKHDEALHMVRKGRWRSGFGVVTYAKPKGFEHRERNFEMIANNTLFTLGQTMRRLVFMQTNLDSKFSEVDAANIRKNIASAIITLRLFALSAAFAVMIKANDDDDEKDLLRYQINVANRLIDDMQMYYSPTSLSNIVKNILPLMSTLTDAQNFIKGIWYLMNGTVTKTGVYAGEDQWVRYIMKSLPIASKIHSTRVMMEQTMNTVR